MTTKNRWQSFDGSEPVAAWTLSVPAPTPAERRAVVDAVLSAGRSTGVLVAGDGAVRGGGGAGGGGAGGAGDGGVDDGELLPWADAVLAGRPVPFSSTVFVRDGQGEVVQRSSGDAGALLRSLEPLDPGYARRFAASHPFAAAWSTATATAITVQVGFFTSLWFDETDGVLLQRNEPAIAAFRAALTDLARRRGGRLTVPPVRPMSYM
jgi:hypothetical protein